VELKTYSQSEIAMNCNWSTLPRLQVDWPVESKEVHRGLVMARSLLSNASKDAFVRVVNCGPTPSRVTAGELLTSAETVDCDQCVTKNTSRKNGYEHVKCLFDALPSELTANQQQQAENFVKSYAHAFSKSATDLGRNKMLHRRINTSENPPVEQPLRRQPYAHLPEIERNVRELLAAKIIEPAQSPWSSNVLLVRKRDRTMRFCVDYRKLKNLTVKDSYPLPRIDTCLEFLGGS
jgi:hypothetical protein